MKLYAQNFLGLERVAWEPRGVSLVVGPNGSGKTSLLAALRFLRTAFALSVPKAVEQLGGPRGLKRLGASPEDPVIIGLEVGDLRWELELGVQGGTLNDYPGERVRLDNQLLVRRAPFSNEWFHGDERVQDGIDDEPRTCLRSAIERRDERVRPLTRTLTRLFSYNEKWSVPLLWDAAPPFGADRFLNAAGQNLFSVLANWRATPRQYPGQYDWVRAQARAAFYDIFDDLEIELQGDGVIGRFYPPGSQEGLPMRRAADGLIIGLLHLTAVAGAAEGAVVAIDEMENHLHPHAIRVIVNAMRERAEERDLTIVLTTHSPVLMDEFAGHLDQFFVTEPGRAETPVRLSELHDPRYLAQFALGDLYERLKFGAPRVSG